MVLLSVDEQMQIVFVLCKAYRLSLCYFKRALRQNIEPVCNNNNALAVELVERVDDKLAVNHRAQVESNLNH